MSSESYQAARYAIGLISEGYSVEDAKRITGKKFMLKKALRNSDLLAACTEEEREMYGPFLIKRKSRTLSGVTPVAVMSLSTCPHGRCIYCPRGEYAAQSYTGKEPAAMRAIQNDYDPYMQVRARLRQYEELGHPTDKCELIIMGGTFLAQSESYKLRFVKECYDGFNGTVSSDLETAKRVNETAVHRVVGLTIETRPDWSFEKHINEMLMYGATRVELGVQVLDDGIYELVKRGHTVDDVVKATRLLKDSGYKVCYHMMPGLFTTPGQDVEFFKQLFSDQRFQPDMLKIYPTMVMEGTELYEMWKRGEYKPYDTETAVETVSEAYRYIPEYVRVMRVQRDIPVKLIVDGVKKSNLRELVESRCRRKGIRIREIRYREVKHRDKLRLQLIRREYQASNGREVFISFEDTDRDVIAGFVRLRMPYKPFRPEITESTALVRELHVYGSEVPIGYRGTVTVHRAVQHTGLGRKLLSEAERVATEEWGMNDIVVISGVGVREYYRNQGYRLKGPYMWKKL
ncbi:tRNA uridine(34) 5-carboxymethylaminomethyl modification radical SAM/GNAT enzyme Elp3 [Candidatus Micrarchaeota archaeon]|nr:tRNA uridine(34) 5-carboxymethylaminomethyl modification radical SAM/GNAT enzyme Elp3 [Candidatus Micrarchaeota archaeon]